MSKLRWSRLCSSLPTLPNPSAEAINHQLGRRNLRPDQVSLLRGERYNLEKQDAHVHPEVSGRPPKKPGGEMSPGFDEDTSADPQGKTAERLGEQYGVDSKTIKRDGKFAAAAKVIEAHSSVEVRELLSSKKVARTKEEFCDLADSLEGKGSLAPAVAESALSLVGVGGVKSLKEAVERAEKAISMAEAGSGFGSCLNRRSRGPEVPQFVAEAIAGNRHPGASLRTAVNALRGLP